MTAISKNVCIDKLHEIFDKYNNIYHRAIIMKPIDVKSSTYINFDVLSNDKDRKFKVDDHVITSE